MSDLAEFLLARIAEDQAVALSATRPPWRPGSLYPNVESSHPTADTPVGYSVDCNPSMLDRGTDGELVVTALDSWDDAGCYGYVAEWRDDQPNFRDASADAAHIARWDPARILAECEAKRRIVEGFAFSDDPRSRVDFWLDQGVKIEPPTAVAEMIRVAKLLALPYADHPDYREEWRP